MEWKWIIGVIVVALVIWFVALHWFRNYRAQKASKKV